MLKARREWECLFSESGVPIISRENQTPIPRRMAEERFDCLRNGKDRMEPSWPAPSAFRFDPRRDAGVDEDLLSRFPAHDFSDEELVVPL